MIKIKEITNNQIEKVENLIVSIGLKYKKCKNNSIYMDKIEQIVTESDKNLNLKVD